MSGTSSSDATHDSNGPGARPVAGHGSAARALWRGRSKSSSGSGFTAPGRFSDGWGAL